MVLAIPVSCFGELVELIDQLGFHTKGQDWRGHIKRSKTACIRCIQLRIIVNNVYWNNNYVKRNAISKTKTLERYEASKQLRGILEKLAGATVYLVQGETFFTLNVMNNASGEVEPFKICMAIFRENRKLRIHVTSAFFARLGEGSPGVPIKRKGFSIFKVAADTRAKRDGQFPKEVRNRFQKK